MNKNKKIILALLSFAVSLANVNAGLVEAGDEASQFPNGASIIVQVSGLKPESYKVVIKDGKLVVTSDNVINDNGDTEKFYYLTHLPDDINGDNITYSVDRDGLLRIGL